MSESGSNPTWVIKGPFRASGQVQSVSVSVDGSRILIGDSGVALHDRDGRELWSQPTRGCATSVWIAEDASLAVAATDGHMLEAFDIAGQVLWKRNMLDWSNGGAWSMPGPRSRVTGLPDGSLIIAGFWGGVAGYDNAGTVQWDFQAPGRRAWPFARGLLIDLACSADGSLIGAAFGRDLYAFDRQGRLLWSRGMRRSYSRRRMRIEGLPPGW